MELFETDQFILTAGLDNILKYHEKIDKVFPYNNLISIFSSHPELAFNRIISTPEDVYSFFNKLTPLQKGYLVPKIELYRKNEKNEDVPIVFRTYLNEDEFRGFVINPETINDLTFKRNDGVGLKRITISDRAERPTDVNISCKIELYFDNILALMNENVLKLIKSPEIRKESSSTDFRVKLVIGWETPQDSGGENFPPEYVSIIEKSNIVYLLELVTHNITLNDNGSILLVIEYQGALEKYFSGNSNTDILDISSIEKLQLFLPTIESGNPKISDYAAAIIEKEVIEDKLEKYYKSSDKDSSQFLSPQNVQAERGEELEALEKRKDELDKKLSSLELHVIKEKYSRILNSILKSNRLYYLTIPLSIVEFLAKSNMSDPNFDAIAGVASIISNPVAITSEPLQKTARDRINDLWKKFKNFEDDLSDADEDGKVADIAKEFQEDIKKEFSKEKQSYNSSMNDANFPGLKDKIKQINIENRFIYYTTLGDIINSIMSFLVVPDDMGVILGPCKIGDKVFNLVDIPISISSFSVWFLNKIIKPVRRKYFLWEFITDIFKDLVIPNMASFDLFGKISSNLTVSMTTIITDKKLEKGFRYDDKDKFNSLSRNISNTKDVNSYLIIFVYDYQLARRDGVLEEDVKDGIYHYGIGRQQGVAKNISFTKVDFPRLRDLRLTGNKLNTPGNVLREHYNMSLKTVGNPLFINGGIIYFDGSFLGLLGRDATELIGLGGYYLVSGIETSIGPGEYEVTANCIWQSMRLGSAENAAKIIHSLSEKATSGAGKGFLKGGLPTDPFTVGKDIYDKARQIIGPDFEIKKISSTGRPVVFTGDQGIPILAPKKKF